MENVNITPDEALNLLKEGNLRFIAGQSHGADLQKQVKKTSEGQFPYAAILGCIDSRTSAELILDQGLGQIINIRIAGNVVNTDILGSLEYSCVALHTKLILVLGHTSCGAIQSACSGLKLGNVTTLLKKIGPAIEAEKSILENRNGDNLTFVNKVSLQNIKYTEEKIRKNSSIIRDLELEGKVRIAGAIYNVETGKVDFIEE